MNTQLAINHLIKRQNLDYQSCRDLFIELLNGTCDPLHAAAILVLLHAKKETPEELTAIINVLKEKVIPIQTQHKVLDIVGTGGDGAYTVNISTGSAILAASCGVKVAKHGGRAVSSRAGAADVLETLGVNINLAAEKISQGIDQIGIGFCYSPNFHPALNNLRQIRKQLGVATSLNILGPLLNPIGKAHYLLGVMREDLIQVMAQTLSQSGCETSMVVFGGGLDEISCVAPIQAVEIRGNELVSLTIDCVDYGFSRCKQIDLQGGDANTNAELLSQTLNGMKGPIADSLILNAAVALKLFGSVKTITEGVKYAQENLYNGSALKLLNNWREFSHA